MHPNAELIGKFYACFGRRDAAGMADCYHPDVVFSDPVFTLLEGPQASAMWKMLCERGKDLAVSCRDVEADDAAGRAHWDADYTFSKTGRKVHNAIDAAFAFRSGKIIQHTDRFSLWKWAGMALGPTGLLLGWAPPLRAAIRKEAAKSLASYVKKQI